MKSLLTIVLCCIASSALAAEPAQPKYRRRSPEQLKAAEEYEVNEVSFKTTLTEFRKRFPNARETPTGHPNQYHFTLIPDGTSRITSYVFDDEKLTHISIMRVGYDEKAFEETLEHLNGRFGKPDGHNESVKGESYLWFADTRTIGLTKVKSRGFMTNVHAHKPLPSHWFEGESPTKKIKPSPPVEQQQ
jgi:hypothetical protein